MIHLPLSVLSVTRVCSEVAGGQVPDVETGDDLAVLVVPDDDGLRVSRLDLGHGVSLTIIIPP